MFVPKQLFLKYFTEKKPTESGAETVKKTSTLGVTIRNLSWFSK